MKKLLAVSVALAALGCAPAFGADLPVKYRPAPLWTWTGFYLGVNGGAGSGTVEAAFAGFPLPISSHGINGFLGGGQLGYNWQQNWLVVGIEGNIDFANIRGTTPCLIVIACTTKVSWIGDVSGRVGFVVDRALIYAKVGVAWASSQYSASIFGFPLVSRTDTREGVLVGFGGEYAITPQWSAKLEYNYIDFGRRAERLQGAGFGINTTINQVQHVMKAGVNYRFLTM